MCNENEWFVDIFLSTQGGGEWKDHNQDTLDESWEDCGGCWSQESSDFPFQGILFKFLDMRAPLPGVFDRRGGRWRGRRCTINERSVYMVMYVYMCMYCTCTCLDGHVLCVCAYAYVCACTCMCTCAYMPRMYTCAYACMYMCMYMYVYTCMCDYTWILHCSMYMHVVVCAGQRPLISTCTPLCRGPCCPSQGHGSIFSPHHLICRID